MEQRVPAVIILAAGRGARMKSELPKVLHQLMGRPLIEHVVNTALQLSPSKIVIVTGNGAEEVEQFISSSFVEKNLESPIFVRQNQQLGTGHAVAAAQNALSGHTGPLLIMCGDMPLITPQTILNFSDTHKALKADLSVMTVRMNQPGSYGRIIRNEGGWLEKIVEARDATDAELLITEINTGIYLGDSDKIFKALKCIKPDNDQNEYYLTDIVTEFRSDGLLVAASKGPDPLEAQGVNDRYELAKAQEVMKNRINQAWMRAGVTMLDPLSTYIEPGVNLAEDVTLWPGVILTGFTEIGSGAEIGPFCHLNNCQINPGVKVAGHQGLSERKI